MPKINGRIIRILDTRTAIINIGRKGGVDNNSVFHILGEPEPVIDPLTKEELGRVVVVKSKLRAEQIHENFTIATTRWTITRYNSALAEVFSSFGGRTEVVDEGEMRVRSKDLQPWKAQSEIPVQVGDIVEVEVRDRPTESSDEADSQKERSDVSGESAQEVIDPSE